MSAFAVTSDGHVWVATDGGGLNRYNPQTDAFIPINLAPGHSFAHQKALTIAADSRDNLWIGYWTGGIDYFDTSSGTVKNYTSSNTSSGPGIAYIFSLYFDRDSTLWAGTWKSGVFRYDSQLDGFSQLTYGTANPFMDNTIINHIQDDTNGNLWIATQNNGLFIYSKLTSSLMHYSTLALRSSGLRAENIQCIVEDSKQRVWLGTVGGGLQLFNPADSTFHAYGIEDGLPSLSVYGIVEDAEGNLWVSTSNGIARIILSGSDSKPNLSVTAFDVQDGLQSNQFTRGAFLGDTQGRLYFGGVNGFNVFHPQSIWVNTSPPPVHITGFLLFNQMVSPGQEDSPLSNHILETESITLKHYHSVLTIKFIALNYINSQKNQYAYYLEPFEKDWNYVGTRREATYTNLKPGSYTFRVKASNNDGVWNQQGSQLRIIILAPWWQTLWFRITLAIILTGVLFLVYHLRMRFLTRQKEQLQREVGLRTRELDQANIALIYKQQEIVQQNEEIASQYEEIQAQKETVEERNRALEEVNEQLNCYRNNLEIIVEKRTAELALAKSRAEESDMLKTAFLTNISHEIRTPLNAIIGFSDIICTMEHEEGERKNLREIIKHNSEYLLQMIDDIIDISRIETGQIVINKKSTPLAEVLDAVGRYQSDDLLGVYRADRGEIAFSVALPDELRGVEIHTDSKRLIQVLSHLIDNAYKYTKRGSIQVGCFQLAENELVFFVKDTGIGIQPQNIVKVFHPFTKIQVEDSTLQRGLGIGLALVKPIVELLGGRIWVESEFGSGSTFYFNHPLYGAGNGLMGDNPIEENPFNLQGVTVLVVEDEASNMMLLERFLTKRNATVFKCWNGLEAVEALKNMKGVDLVLMDLRMPVMGGVDAFRIIRNMHPDLPVIAQTALVLAHEVAEIKAMGFNDFITKPIGLERLMDVIVSVLRNDSKNQSE